MLPHIILNVEGLPNMWNNISGIIKQYNISLSTFYMYN